MHEGSTVAMEIPAEYLEELDTLLVPFTDSTNQVTIREAERAVGKAGRVSQIIKEARPFTGAMYAAFTASKQADASGPRNAEPGMVPCRRFATAARWMRMMISGPDNCIMPLIRLVDVADDKLASTRGPVIQFDASIWGLVRP